MVIKAGTDLGKRTSVHYQDGTTCTLRIAEYDTETQAALIYELTEWTKSDDSQSREIRTYSVIIPGSYAMVDGQKV